MKKKRFGNKMVLVSICLLMAVLWHTPCVYSQEKTLTIVLEDWSSEIASANVIKAVLKQRLNVKCVLKRMSVTDQYEALSNGSMDVSLGAWMPSQQPYYEKYKNGFIDLGPNLEGAQLGLVVPQVSSTWLLSQDGQHTEPYMKIDSIEELNSHFDEFRGKIYGIEEDSGMMKTMRESLIPAYGLENFELVAGDEVTITAHLADAIKKKKWVVVLGWTPHWKFGRWKLKFLDDPKEIWKGTARIHTLVRKGLKQEMPKVYQVLDNFSWTPEEMEKLLVWNEMKDTPYENALRWMNYNKVLIDSWFQ